MGLREPGVARALRVAGSSKGGYLYVRLVGGAGSNERYGSDTQPTKDAWTR